MKMRSWYRILAQADPEIAELLIFDEIGRSFWNDEAVTAKQFVADLQALPEAVKTVRVRINSPGGDPFDATAIANALRAQRTEKGRTVEVSIEGLAASAASIVTSAGDPIRMADNAILMIHDPFALVVGDAGDMRKMAEALDTIRDAIIATYQWVSPLDAAELAELMAAETWMDAEAALKNGFATEIVKGLQVAASFRPESVDRLGSIPEAYRTRVDALVLKPALPPTLPLPIVASAAEVLRACTSAGCLDLAEGLITAGATLEQVQARTSAAKEIRALCATAKLPELAAGYIQADTPATIVREHLTTLTARLDPAEIDGQLPPDAGRPRARIDTAGVYRQWNQPAKGA